MRWNDRTERLIRDALGKDSCPLCGGRVRNQASYLGNGMRYIERVCDACGMVVGPDEGGWDHEDI